MEHAKLGPRHPGQRNSGVALIVVLMLVVLTTILMLAFFLSVQTETKSMSSVVYGQNSRQLADIATQSVIAQIQQATTQGTTVAWASQPGMIRTYDNTGAALGWYKLYSATTNFVATPSETLTSVTSDLPTSGWTAGSANYGIFTDVNSPVYGADGTTNFPVVNPAGATSLNANPVQGFDIKTSSTPGYASATATGPDNNPAAMPVRWIYVLRDGTQVPAVASGTIGKVTVTGASKSNPIVGRIGYWTDDETCKLNINTAGDGSYFDTPRFCGPYANTNNLPTVTPPSAQDAGIVQDHQIALTPPLGGEYQRYIGHPAQTRLSYALGSTIANSGMMNRSNLMTLLSPFMQWGGSNAGTLITWNGSMSNTLATPQRQTPYASLDEWMFSNAALSSNNRVPSPGTTAASPPALLTNTNLQQLRFFLSANSDAPEVNLFGQPRISMWPIYTPTLTTNVLPTLPSNYVTGFDQMIAKAATLTPSTTSTYTYYFGRQNAGSPTIDWGDTTNKTMSLTVPTNNTRNQNIFVFLRKLSQTAMPGYGFNFWQKYGGSSGGAGEMDQILTEIFDYIRSTNPADVMAGSRYAATGQSASPNVADGGAQVTPITIGQANFGNLYTTKGMGRFDTINEISLDFTNSFAPAYNANGTVDSTHVIITGLIYLSLYSPSVGYTSLTPHLRIVAQTPGTAQQINMTLIANQPSPAAAQNFSVFGTLSNTMANNGANSGRTYFSVIPPYANPGGNNNGWNNGPNSSLLWGGVSGARQLLLSKRASYSNGTTGTQTPIASNYELCGVNMKIPTTTTSLSMAATPIEFKIYHTDAKPTDTVSNGGGDGYPGAAADLVQDITVTLPAFSNLPLPTNSTGADDASTYNLDNRFQQQGYCVQTYPVPSGGLFIESGDVVQSLIGGYNGDLRLIAAQQVINDTVNTGTLGSAPSPAFVGHPLNNIATHPMAHSQKDIFPHQTQPGWSNNSTTAANVTGQLVPTATYATALPNTGFIDASLVGTAKIDPNLTGDWDNGWGGFADGPWINKPDEAGSQYETSKGIYGSAPYYGGEASSPYAVLSSPNRTVASPVMFGSLPTGVPIGKWNGSTYTAYPTVEAPNGQAIPWQTLLFRPQPNHYGSSSGGTQLEDEMMLDWFWMPVVEPYAISTTLATAGKVNMNYQIAPFTYITRATALMGVLGSEYVISVPTSAGPKYKSDGGASYPTYRSPVKVLKADGITYDDDAGTLRQFRDRFANGLIFKSAAEICDIYLEPTVDSSTGSALAWGAGSTAGNSTSYINDAQTYWGNNLLTGDNTRERPYNGLYSRLTTKSNTYTVHVRAQALVSPSTLADNTWVENPALISSEYRGSVTINRYLDPQDPNIPDLVAHPLSASIDNYYKYRVLETRRFLP